MSQTRTKQEEIDRNLRYFNKNLPELLEKHRDKYALLRNEEIIGIYDTVLDAQMIGLQMFDDDLFSVQKVTDISIDLGFYSHAMHLGTA